MELYESFMKFSFADEDIFLIEEDPLVKDIHPTCECVVLISEKVAFIEAKSSSPRPGTRNYTEFFDEIRKKFDMALQMFVEIKSGGYGEEPFLRLPDNLRLSAVPTSDYAIYLIIHGNEYDWMPGLQESLRETLREVIDRWNIQDTNVKALNEIEAKRMNLIVSYIPVDRLSEVKVDDSEQSRRNAMDWFNRQATEGIELADAVMQHQRNKS